MLKVSYIIENKKQVINALSKRNFEASKIIKELELYNSKRRKIQSELENILSRSNKISKEIGELIKSGNTDQANKIKDQTAKLKENSKEFNIELNSIKNKIQDLLYKIPNIPNESVPVGNGVEDNVEIYNNGDLPMLDSYVVSDINRGQRSYFNNRDQAVRSIEVIYHVYLVNS